MVGARQSALLEIVILVSVFHLVSVGEAVASEVGEAASSSEDSSGSEADDEGGAQGEMVAVAETRQLELMAVGFFESSGSLSPGARAAFEVRPWNAFGLSGGATFVATSRQAAAGEVDGRRVGADFAGTTRHGTGPVLSSAGLGVRAGWVWFSGAGLEPEPSSSFYSQIFFRGRGEWSFASQWYLIFQMELSIAVVPVDVVAEGVPVEDIRGLEADLGLGIGYRF